MINITLTLTENEAFKLRKLVSEEIKSYQDASVGDELKRLTDLEKKISSTILDTVLVSQRNQRFANRHMIRK